MSKMDVPFDLSAYCSTTWEAAPRVTVGLLESRALSMSAPGAVRMALGQLVDAIGLESAKAQKLGAPITTASKLQQAGPEHQTYMCFETSSAGSKVMGFIKTGKKALFMLTPAIAGPTSPPRLGRARHTAVSAAPAMIEVTPLCVLDFFVFESCRRTGVGKMLFDSMARHQRLSHPALLAFDRPSAMFLGFLAKHFGLTQYTPQANNYVMFHDYWTVSRMLQEQPGAIQPYWQRLDQSGGAGQDGPHEGHSGSAGSAYSPPYEQPRGQPAALGGGPSHAPYARVDSGVAGAAAGPTSRSARDGQAGYGMAYTQEPPRRQAGYGSVIGGGYDRGAGSLGASLLTRRMDQDVTPFPVGQDGQGGHNSGKRRGSRGGYSAGAPWGSEGSGSGSGWPALPGPRYPPQPGADLSVMGHSHGAGTGAGHDGGPSGSRAHGQQPGSTDYEHGGYGQYGSGASTSPSRQLGGGYHMGPGSGMGMGIGGAGQAYPSGTTAGSTRGRMAASQPSFSAVGSAWPGRDAGDGVATGPTGVGGPHGPSDFNASGSLSRPMYGRRSLGASARFGHSNASTIVLG